MSVRYRGRHRMTFGHAMKHDARVPETAVVSIGAHIDADAAQVIRKALLDLQRRTGRPLGLK